MGLVALGLVAPLIALESVAAAAMPPLAWRGVEKIAVLCSVDAGGELGHAEIARDLCERIVRIAEPASPMSFEIVEFDSSSLGAAGSATLLVHASLLPASVAVPGARGKLIGWTMRTTATSGIDGLSNGPANPFGAAPRVVPYGGDELDEGLRASLGDVLPWMRTANVADLPLQQLEQPERGYLE